MNSKSYDTTTSPTQSCLQVNAQMTFEPSQLNMDKRTSEREQSTGLSSPFNNKLFMRTRFNNIQAES